MVNRRYCHTELFIRDKNEFWCTYSDAWYTYSSWNNINNSNNKMVKIFELRHHNHQQRQTTIVVVINCSSRCSQDYSISWLFLAIFRFIPSCGMGIGVWGAEQRKFLLFFMRAMKAGERHERKKTRMDDNSKKLFSGKVHSSMKDKKGEKQTTVRKTMTNQTETLGFWLNDDATLFPHISSSSSTTTTIITNMDGVSFVCSFLFVGIKSSLCHFQAYTPNHTNIGFYF